jgi:hypothetical protein
MQQWLIFYIVELRVTQSTTENLLMSSCKVSDINININVSDINRTSCSSPFNKTIYACCTYCLKADCSNCSAARWCYVRQRARIKILGVSRKKPDNLPECAGSAFQWKLPITIEPTCWLSEIYLLHSKRNIHSAVRFLYRWHEHRKCQGTSRRIQALHAAELPRLLWR